MSLTAWVSMLVSLWVSLWVLMLASLWVSLLLSLWVGRNEQSDSHVVAVRIANRDGEREEWLFKASLLLEEQVPARREECAGRDGALQASRSLPIMIGPSDSQSCWACVCALKNAAAQWNCRMESVCAERMPLKWPPKAKTGSLNGGS